MFLQAPTAAQAAAKAGPKINIDDARAAWQPKPRIPVRLNDNYINFMVIGESRALHLTHLPVRITTQGSVFAWPALLSWAHLHKCARRHARLLPRSDCMATCAHCAGLA